MTDYRHTCTPRTAGGKRPTLTFAYGSNLDGDQMLHRCPAAVLVGPALLEGYQLAFSGWSGRWGGAVATVVPWAGAVTPGVIWALNAADLRRLDGFEGATEDCTLGPYTRVQRPVTLPSGHHRRVHLYLKPELDLGPPSRDYVATIRRGYALHGFDPDCLNRAIALSTEDF